MTRTARLSSVCPALSCALLGCGQAAPGEDAVADRAQATFIDNGTWMNGTWMNGTTLVDGTPVAGIVAATFRGGRRYDLPLTGVRLDRTRFTGDQGVTSDSGLVGARFTGQLATGAVVTFQIFSITPPVPGDRAYDDMYHYDLIYQPRPGSTWEHVCGGGMLAVPANGHWDGSGTHQDDGNRFTFSCDNGAVAKCLRMGYKPWLTRSELYIDPVTRARASHTFSLEQHHQACTRMVRGDWCGDGTATTINGTPIDISDNFGIQSPSQPSDGLNDWTPVGARYRGGWRTGPNQPLDYINAHCPGKWPDSWPNDGVHGIFDGSTFTTGNGFYTPMNQRVLLREHRDINFLG